MAGRKTVRVDVTSDTVCPWCFVGKKNLDAAVEETKDKYDVVVRWLPFQLNPDASQEGRDKLEYYNSKFGAARVKPMVENMRRLFAERGLDYKMGGKTGNTLDSHRLLELAAQQSPEKQNALVEELFKNYFSEEKYIGDRDVLLAAAKKVGVEGAEEWLADPKAGLAEVSHHLERIARMDVHGVPFFQIGKVGVSGAQPKEVFLEAFEKVAKAT